jgi:pimeloyl-ACP methyl ester carboxylesterase
LVLLPGMNCSAALWSGLDIEPALTPKLTEPFLDRQVDHLLDRLPPRFSLAGLSLGGIVAMAIVRRAPERVIRLCLMSTNPYPPTAEQRRSWTRQRTELASGLSPRNLQRGMLADLLSPETLATRPALVERTLEIADEVGAVDLDAQLRLQATRVDERPELANVKCPTLIVAGAHDALCGLDRHVEMAALIPDAELVILNCGHLSPLECPDEVSEHLSRWRYC